MARDLARALGAASRKTSYYEGNGYTVTWATGHLVGLAEPHQYDSRYKTWRLSDLPIIPDEYKLVPLSRASQLASIVSLLRRPDFDYVVNACDAGREGELVFRWIVQWSGASVDIRRLWLSSLTKTSIDEAMSNLRPADEYDGLAEAARCRAESDWLVGINATRAMSRKSRSLVSVGRVQTPTLSLIVCREKQIEQFAEEDFWTVRVLLDSEHGQFEAYWSRAGGTSAERISSLDEAKRIEARLAQARSGEVAEVSHKEVRLSPPALYDLTSLQRQMNTRYGYSAHKTLALAQSLYERKAITYPRTDSRFITRSTIPLVVRALQTLRASHPEQVSRIMGADSKPDFGALIRESLVRDHHAILPTSHTPKLVGEQRVVYEAVCSRLLAALYPASIRRETALCIHVGSDTLCASGTKTIALGWREIEPGAKDNPLPELSQRDAVTVVEVEAKQSRTRPPERYTDASLLRAMQSVGRQFDDDALRQVLSQKGLGTPATRAAIIERLIEVGYVERHARHLLPTAKGRQVVETLPVRELTSAELTAEWEMRLQQVQEQSLSRDEYMKQMQQFVREMVQSIKHLKQQKLLDALGECPRCGAQVVPRGGGFRCVSSCGFALPPQIASKKISRKHAEALLSRKKTPLLQGFRSKTGGRFRAYLVLAEDHTLKLEFPKKRASYTRKRRTRSK